jgi:hypothetical protein
LEFFLAAAVGLLSADIRQIQLALDCDSGQISPRTRLPRAGARLLACRSGKARLKGRHAFLERLRGKKSNVKTTPVIN